MRLLNEWRERRDRDWRERWDRNHRWDALATYNSEVHRGIGHTPGYDALMAQEQEKFNAEHGPEHYVKASIDDDGADWTPPHRFPPLVPMPGPHTGIFYTGDEDPSAALGLPPGSVARLPDEQVAKRDEPSR